VKIRRILCLTPALLAGLTLAAEAQAGFDPEARLRELKLELPAPRAPVANYVSAVRTGNLVFLAGHGECQGDAHTGKVPRDQSIEDGYAAARNVGLCLLASLKAEIGDLRKVKRIVRVFGMVNSTEDFTQQPKVINGCSDLLVTVFGERGRHARAAVGMQSLPNNITVEIEMVVEVTD
jgi:enamine deaminase RidA (YjgF/YER057c/UK114 family)